MSLLLAPVALRMPISAVRSVTDISNTFITPIPPTTTEMPTIKPMITLNNKKPFVACSIR